MIWYGAHKHFLAGNTNYHKIEDAWLHAVPGEAQRYTRHVLHHGGLDNHVLHHDTVHHHDVLGDGLLLPPLCIDSPPSPM